MAEYRSHEMRRKLALIKYFIRLLRGQLDNPQLISRKCRCLLHLSRLLETCPRQPLHLCTRPCPLLTKSLHARSKSPSARFIDVYLVELARPCREESFTVRSLFTLQLAAVVRSSRGWQHLALRVHYADVAPPSPLYIHGTVMKLGTNGAILNVYVSLRLILYSSNLGHYWYIQYYNLFQHLKNIFILLLAFRPASHVIFFLL